MIPIHDLVGEIQELLYADVEWDVGRLQQLAKGYAEACNRMMTRAQRCRELFDQGSKKEAFDTARKDPDLEEQLALLDFDNRAAWLDMCERMQLPTPGDFDGAPVRDLLDQLNEGSSNIDRLLRVYRRMSVGGAPLMERLTVLRRLRREDYRETCWDEDIHVFERAAVDELVQHARTADLAGDLPKLEAVLVQLASDEWLEKPSMHAKAVEGLILPHRTAFVRKRYADLLPPLQEAFGRKDEQTGRGLIARWGEIEAASGVRPDGPAAAALWPIREWLAEQERLGEAAKAHRAACAKLDSAIAMNADLKSLESLAATVQKFGLPMPEDLETRATNRLRALRSAARRRYVLRLASTVTVAVVLCVGIIAVKSHVDWRQSVLTWQDRIGSLLDKQEFEAAGKLLNTVAAEQKAVDASAEIQDMHARYAKMLKDDDMRRVNFKRAVAAAAESVAGTPDRISLKRAEVLARTAEEKQQALECGEKVRKRLDELRRQKVAELDLLVAKLEADRDTANKAFNVRLKDFQPLAERCLALAEQIELATEVTQAQRTRVESVRQSVLNLKKDAEDRETQAEISRRALAEIARLYENPKVLGGELQSFAQRFPGHPLSREFIESAKFMPQWEALDAWKRLAAFLAVPEYPVEKRLQAMTEYLKTHPGSVLQRPVTQYKQYFGLKESVFAGGRMKHLAEARELVNDRFIADVYMVQTRKGYTCYLLKDEELKASTLNGVAVRFGVDAIVDRALKRRMIPVNAVDLIDAPAPAPQTRFAKAAAEIISKVNNQKWETFYLRLAEQAMAVTDMDPILRIGIVKSMLDYARDTTPFEYRAIEDISGTLAEHLTPVNWIDPENREAEQLRPKAAAALDEVKTLAPLIEKVEKQLDDLAASVATYRPVGVVLSPSGDTPEQMAQITVVELVDNGPLYAVMRGGGGFEMQKVAEARNGQAITEKGLDLGSLCGSPVYARSK